MSLHPSPTLIWASPLLIWPNATVSQVPPAPSGPYSHLPTWQTDCGGLITKSCSTLCDPVDCSPPDSSVHANSQARILEWVAIWEIFLTQELNPHLLQCRWSLALQEDSLPTEPSAWNISLPGHECLSFHNLGLSPPCLTTQSVLTSPHFQYVTLASSFTVLIVLILTKILLFSCLAISPINTAQGAYLICS